MRLRGMVRLRVRVAMVVTKDMSIRKGTADLAMVLARITGPRMVLLTWLGVGVGVVGVGLCLGVGQQ